MAKRRSYIQEFQENYGSRLTVNITKEEKHYYINSVVFSTKNNLERILGETEIGDLEIYCSRSYLRNLENREVKMYFVRIEPKKEKPVSEEKLKAELEKMLKEFDKYVKHQIRYKDPEEERLSYELGVIVNLHRNF